MAEALISPGVFLRENDQSQITAGPVAVGAALIGPTVTGRKDIPTLVTSYSQYKAKFGTTFISGGNTQEYMTSQAAYNYFQQGGESLLVTRVASGSYTAATASISNRLTLVAGTVASASFAAANRDTGSWNIMYVTYPSAAGSITYTIYNYPYASTGSYFQGGTYLYVGVGSQAAGFPSNAVSSVSNWISLVTTAINNASTPINNIRASGSTTILTLSAASAGTYGNAYQLTRSLADTPVAYQFANGTEGSSATAFELETISVGTAMNNNQGAASAINGVLPSGSNNNVRWQIVQSDTGSGLFTLLVRAGNDYTSNQAVLETWSNISLDPNQNNYISYVIGDQSQTVLYDESGQAYLQITGSYPNLSNYIRVKAVNTPTPNYLNPQGRPYSQYTASIPVNGSGSLNGAFGGATGPLFGCDGLAPLNLFEQIPTVESVVGTPTTNIQGVFAGDYDTALNLLANQDSYLYNSIYTPGLTSQNGPSQISALLSTVANRGDAIAVVDMVGYNQGASTVSIEAQSYDNSYGATYWPWVQIRSTETGRLNFVPASVVIPGVYEYNDKVSAEWFAPAGLNRGGLPTVLQPETRLTVAQRNDLYSAKVNPIAVFPGQGTVVYGQKTLQARASALDRVNVRRLLIALKGYIGQIAQTLVFEQNTAVTRNKFLSQVNPYLEYVQQRQGLYAFRVVMDDTNNTPDVIDRNLLVGAIYLQPTRTAEFIQLDFNILPTGVSFGQ
jgi:hypothetical protein